MKLLIKSFVHSVVVLASVLFSLAACKNDNKEPAANIPDLITFSSETLYPEGIAYYSKSQTFLVSSIKHGTIGAVDLKGQYTLLLNDPSLISTYGLKVSGRFLYACTGDIGNGSKSSPSTATRIAKVIKYDLDQKKIVQTYDLSALFKGALMPNDLAVDDQENLYITEALTGFLYKIDKAGTASVFLESNLFKGEGFNLNGIVFHKAGYLLVGKTNEGKIFKVNLADKSITEVALPAPIAGADGLTLNGESLYVVNYSSGTVFELKSTDNWQTATLASQDNKGYEGATAATVAEGKTYILNAKVLEIVTNPATASSNTFSIKRYKAQ
jgi:sugar lactone lactonase YvrE